ncbi:hypothetical protein [Paraglaciecola psychrophila]|uniref:Uncharacterized protein n=1 Tax=Paraglaciecola psychrophila 170 TaxID=1129794 RepID=K6ZJU9_9ALTE|nr:hypothetical protein [Paraglaciecola psychrophila]AGH44894.1 hypothetical protein C427_2785 [Paraglaciecola psychrophila 170]GAC36251.1 hypothetical protein GPSY_0613 [Paraglaciecola psychrophila 170]
MAHNKLVDHLRYLSVVNKVVVRSYDSEVTEDNEQFKQTHIDNELVIELTRKRRRISETVIGRLPQPKKTVFC